MEITLQKDPVPGAIKKFKKHRHEFYIDLANAMNEGDTPLKFLTARHERALERKNKLAPLYELWIQRLEDGSMAFALEGTVPDNDVLVIEAAQKSDTLVTGLRFLAETIKQTEKMRSAVLGAVVLPIVVMAMLIAMLVGFSLFMVPLISKLMKPEFWPAIGKALYAVSQVVVTWGPYLLALLVAGVIAYFRSLSRWGGPKRVWLDEKLVIYTIYRDYSGSLFCVLLAALMKADVGIKPSLETLQERANGWLSWHIEEISARLYTESSNNGRAFATGVFNERLTDRVIDYGARESFSSALEKIGLDTIEETRVVVERSAKWINYSLLGICGVMMLFMIAGTMLTLQESSSAMRKQTQMLRR